MMTIVEAIKTVLQEAKESMTAQEIYDKIVEDKLYSFGAKDPVHVVNCQIRRRCKGLEFPTAYPTKAFEMAGICGRKTKFRLLSSDPDASQKGAIRECQRKEDMLPEEKIGAALEEHIRFIRQQVLDCVINNTSTFFEHIVIDLLLKMGYGFGEGSGTVTGRSHDGGIDGIISEDKLGLDLIYIQAKKYSESNKVGRRELQAFIGAMQDVRKGVFITTSTFTAEARKYISIQQQKNVKLIDGKLLSNLLVEHEVGVNRAQTFTIYKIDYEYYEE